MRVVLFVSLVFFFGFEACWADFPDSRFLIDAGSGIDVVSGTDQNYQESSVGDLTKDDAFSCIAKSFIRCLDADTLIRCNASETAEENEACSPFVCASSLGRCAECDPKTGPICSNNQAISCNSEGKKVAVSCPYGCSLGICCVDKDKDKFSACTGDCNDDDPLVHPNQTEFQIKASNGSYDYNCDTKDTLEYPDLAQCIKNGGDCQGNGWKTSVPKCGDSGEFITCNKKGSGCEEVSSTVTQRCL